MGWSMNKRVIAIVGSYRKGGITDQAVDVMLETVKQKGSETEKIYLLDQPIEFCTNCRTCTQQGTSESRGRCVLRDGLDHVLDKIDAADGLILASPVNFFTVTALMKRFIERLVSYAYWPWGQHAPQNRIRKKSKKSVVVTSSACPSWMSRFLMPNAVSVMKAAAEVVGSKVVKTIYYGSVCLEEKQKLSDKQRQFAASAAAVLV
jgi:multimeric flavodoxin WrbA